MLSSVARESTTKQLCLIRVPKSFTFRGRSVNFRFVLHSSSPKTSFFSGAKRFIDSGKNYSNRGRVEEENQFSPPDYFRRL